MAKPGDPKFEVCDTPGRERRYTLNYGTLPIVQLDEDLSFQKLRSMSYRPDENRMFSVLKPLVNTLLSSL